MDHSPYVLHLIGRAELRGADGSCVTGLTRRTLLLLAILATEPERAFWRHDLARTVWETSPEDRARCSLRNALAVLRKALPPGAIVGDGDLVSLCGGAVAVPLDGEDDGEFMPGIEGDWVVERRLRLRAERVRQAVRLARSADDPDGAIGHAERACRLDPLDAEAAALRGELLRRRGRAGEASGLEGTFRTRSVRELGMLPEPMPSPAPPVGGDRHPLVTAAEWLLAHDPASVCAFLAGTQEQWMAASVVRASEIHERALALGSPSGPDRRSVAATAHYLRTISGEAGGTAGTMEDLLRTALADGERAVAFQLLDALAYAHLSWGDFGTAHVHARTAHDLASGESAGRRAATALNLGLIELHVGDEVSARRRIVQAYRLIETSGGAQTVASARIVYAGTVARAGRPDRAVEMLDASRRELDPAWGARQRVWLELLEFEIHECLGDDVAALGALERARATVQDAGQAAVALTDDAFARVYDRLGEVRLAAESLVRAKRYRQRVGTVRSVYERATMAPAIDRIGARLSPADRRAAFARANA